MSSSGLITITTSKPISRPQKQGKILLVKPPYFTPWTPPLGIAIMKSFMAQHGYSVTCDDFNVDPELWGVHHKYFAVLQTLEDVSINDGYSKLWWILNAHMLGYANGAAPDVCARILETVTPLYGIHCDERVINSLISLVNKFFRRLEELIDELDLSDFTTVGTSTYTTSLASSLFFLKKIKQKWPHITTVMGGGVFADDLALGSDNLNTLIEEYPYVDHIVLGEGELLFLKLIDGELSHKRVISIADIKGNTLNMKDVPIPDFSDLNVAGYYHMTIEGARSCPFQCSFCSETIQWGEYRKKPMDLFTEQVIELSEKYNNNAFFMGDSLMNPYIAQFATSLLQQKTAILYDGYLRADKPITHRDRLEIWARSGLFRVRLGLESASARVLASMDKMTTPQVISDSLKALANTGIRTTTYWIVGFQNETEEEFEETCAFIRENHRYIYELEAHPHAYYPYGQVGSRLHESYSLYPDDISEVIKFKVWDIKDSNPTREEKFDRLRRISSLASELGIPNIYTMADRYKAETRWHLLHPLAVEVHEGTRPHREEIQLPQRPIPCFSEESEHIPAQETPHANSTLCYQVAIKKKLDETKLSASIKSLFRFNEMLRVRLEDGKYLPTPVDEAHLGDMLSVYYSEEETRNQIIESLSADMRPEPAASVRVALMVHEDGSCKLLFLVHQAIADSQSVILLLEDLFRIYEQLSHGKEISLRPVQKTYVDFIDNSTIDRSRVTANIRNLNASVVSVPFDKTVVSRMFSGTLAEYGVKPMDVFATALLKSLAILNKSTDVDVTNDYRLIDTSLEHTVGVLTRTRQLDPEVVRNVPGLKEVQSALVSLGNVETVPLHENAAKKERVLLNLKYLTGEPWLGGNEWMPQGFVLNEKWLEETYQIEIAPVIFNSSFAVCLKYQDKTETKEFIKLLAAQLTREVELLLEYCEHYVAAKKFWLNEFRRSVPKPNLEIESGELTTTDAGMGYVSCAVERDVLAKIQSEYKADISLVILAAYAVLLSRLNGREELVIVTCLGKPEAMNLAPLRLFPSWNLSFAEFVGEIVRTSPPAFEHEAHAFDILANELPESEHTASGPIFDVGYIFKQSAEAGELIGGINETLKRVTPNRPGLGFTLAVAGSAGNLSLEFIYEPGRFAQPVIEKVASYMGGILEVVSRNADVHLGDVALEGALKNNDAIEALANVTFNF